MTMSENQYLLATALFYTDSEGQVLLASGPVPPTTDVTIKNDIVSRANNVIVKVVPIYKTENDIPIKENVVEFVKAKYPIVYVTPVPKRLSRSIMADVMHYLVHRRLEKNEANATKVNGSLDNTNDTNCTTAGNYTDIDNSTIGLLAKHEDRVWSSPKDFVPNDIYYAVEKKCVNWADNCNMNPFDYMNMSSSYFRFLYRPPFVLNWME